MPFSPTPNHPLTLPRTILTIPAAKNPLRLTQIPHLKIGITPHVVVPVPLISERAIGRALDDCVDMIVPVGGRVAIAVNVETGVLLGLDASCEDELVVEEEVKNRVRETTTRVSGSSMLWFAAETLYPEQGTLGLAISALSAPYWLGFPNPIRLVTNIGEYPA